MSIFACISKGFSIAKSSGSLVLAVFLFSFVWALINLPFASPANATQPGLMTAVLGVLFMLISIFIQAGSIGYVEQVAKQGKSSLAVFALAGRKNFLRMLGLGLIVGLGVLILAVLAVLGFVAGAPQAEPNPIAVVVAVVVAVIGLVGLLFLFFAPYAVVVDGKGVFSSLKDSIGIVKKNFVKVLAVGAVLVLIGFAVGFVLGLAAGLLSGVLPGKIGQGAVAMLSSGVNSVLGVITTGSFMALYLSNTGASDQASANT